MRLSAVLAAISLCLATPLIGQPSQTPRQALTRVSAPLREAPDIDARSLITIPPKTAVNVSGCKDGWCAVNYQQHSGHVIEVFLRFPSVAAPSATRTSAGRGYVNSRGEWIPSPVATVDGRPPSGASAQCRDGTYSFSRSRSGTCSHHGGVSRWL